MCTITSHLTLYKRSKILSSHSSDYGDYCLLEYDMLECGKCVPSHHIKSQGNNFLYTNNFIRRICSNTAVCYSEVVSSYLCQRL